jgi:regulator of replication initiation timing
VKDKVNVDLKDQKIDIVEVNKGLDKVIKQDYANKIDFDKFKEILDGDIMPSKDLPGIQSDLTRWETDVRGTSADMADKIKNINVLIKNVDDDLKPLKTDMTTMKKHLDQLQNQTKPIKSDAEKLKDALKKANDVITKNTTTYVKTLITKYTDETIGIVTDGVEHVKTQLKTKVLRCKPVANLYDGVHTFLCDNMIQNSNGFWLALGWCLLFFIPSIILAVKLAKYFRKMDYSTGMDTIVVDHPPYNDKMPSHHDLRAPPPYTSTQHNNPGYQHA